MAGKSAGRLATIFVLIPILLAAWFLAPFVLPVYRWRYVDFTELAKKTGVPQKQLERDFEVSLRFNPRGLEDPAPWQIITMTPTWLSLDDKHNDEDHLLVRCVLISERDGDPPSKLFLGSGSIRDRYWSGHVWRLPPGSLPDVNKKRPILLYKDTLEKQSIGYAEVTDYELGKGGKWLDDDKDVDDGFKR